MKSIGKSNEVSKSALSIAYFAAALVLTPVAAAAVQLANPPFSFACTTDGGHRLGCDSGWVYR